MGCGWKTLTILVPQILCPAPLPAPSVLACTLLNAKQGMLSILPTTCSANDDLSINHDWLILMLGMLVRREVLGSICTQVAQ